MHNTLTIRNNFPCACSAKLKHPRLAWTQDKRMVKLKRNSRTKNGIPNPFDLKKESSRPLVLPATTTYNSSFQVSDCTSNSDLWSINHIYNICEYRPIIEYPESPKVKENHTSQICEVRPIIEYPESPKVEETDIPDIEDLLKYDSDEEFIVLNLRSQEFKQPLSNPYENNYGAFRSAESSRALVNLSPEDANVPLPKQINPARLRTEHQV